MNLINFLESTGKLDSIFNSEGFLTPLVLLKIMSQNKSLEEFELDKNYMNSASLEDCKKKLKSLIDKYEIKNKYVGLEYSEYSNASIVHDKKSLIDIFEIASFGNKQASNDASFAVFNEDDYHDDSLISNIKNNMIDELRFPSNYIEKEKEKSKVQIDETDPETIKSNLLKMNADQ